jgi:hypothetical protein
VRALIAVTTGPMALASLILILLAARMPQASFRLVIETDAFMLAVGRSTDASKTP